MVCAEAHHHWLLGLNVRRRCGEIVSLLVVRVPAAEVDAASDWLWSIGCTAVEERPPDVAGRVELTAGFPDAELALAARSLLGERWPTRFEEPPDESLWRDVWLKHLVATEVAGFCLHPPWNEPFDTARRALAIDPGQAFGSGHHPTTRLAIEALAAVVQPGDSVLDVGCGTGVLAIVAAALGATDVVGIDLEPAIVELARTNAEANDVSADFTTTALTHVDRSFDVVVLNVTIGTQRVLRADADARWRRALVLTGLLSDQGDELAESSAGTTVATEEADGWRSLSITKRSTPPSLA